MPGSSESSGNPALDLPVTETSLGRFSSPITPEGVSHHEVLMKAEVGACLLDNGSQSCSFCMLTHEVPAPVDRHRSLMNTCKTQESVTALEEYLLCFETRDVKITPQLCPANCSQLPPSLTS